MKILVVCTAGMSTSLLVEKMKEAARNQEIDAQIKAIPLAQFEDEIKDADVVLLGPQIRYKLESLKRITDSFGKPIDAIDMRAYGTVDGKKVLEQALDLYEKGGGSHV